MSIENCAFISRTSPWENDRAYTSDNYPIITDIGIADSNFPFSNMQQYDLNELFKMFGPGLYQPGNPGPTRDKYLGGFIMDTGTSTLTWTSFVGIFGHNFRDFYREMKDDYGATDLIFCLLGSNLTPPPLATSFRVDLSAYMKSEDLDFQPPVIHRPYTSSSYTLGNFRYWELYWSFNIATQGGRLNSPSLSIGRFIIERCTGAAACRFWQPTYNHDRNYIVEMHDPSPVYPTVGQARRIVERSRYKALNLSWSAPNNPLPSEDIESLRRIFLNHGTRYPCVLIRNPGVVPTGETTHTPANISTETLYGNFQSPLTTMQGINDLGEVHIYFTEQPGPPS